MNEQINIGSLSADVRLETDQFESDIASALAAIEQLKQKLAGIQAASGSGEAAISQLGSELAALTALQAQLTASLEAAIAAQVQAASRATVSAEAYVSQATATRQVAEAHSELEERLNEEAGVIEQLKHAQAELSAQSKMDAEVDIALMKFAREETERLAAAKRDAAAASLKSDAESESATILAEMKELERQIASEKAAEADLAAQRKLDAEVDIALMRAAREEAEQLARAKQEAAATATAALASDAESESALILAQVNQLKREAAEATEKLAQESAKLAKESALEAAVIEGEISILQHEAAELDRVAKAFQQMDRAIGAEKLHEFAQELEASAEATTMVAVGMQGAAGKADSFAVNTKQANQELEKARARASGASMAFMQFGYAIDDIQYGFRSIVNNIGPFGYSVGTAFGMATAEAMTFGSTVQIIGVLGYQAYEHWDELMDLIGTGKVRTEAEEMDELAKKTGKTADETARLNKYKREQHQIQQMLEGKSKDQKDREKDIEKEIAEFGDDDATGGEKIVKGIADVLRAGGMGRMTPQDEKAIEDLKTAPMADPRKPWWNATLDTGDQTNPARKAAIDKKQEDIQKRINDEIAQRAKDLVVGAANDPEAMKALIAKIEANPKAFPEGAAEKLKEQLPENRAFMKEGLETNEWLEKQEAKDKIAQTKADNEREKKVNEAAREMGQGSSLIKSLGGKMDVAAVFAALIKNGMGEAEARGLAPEVHAKLKADTAHKVRQHALANGLTIDQARDELSDETKNKLNERFAKEARRVAPGVDKFAEHALAGGFLGGKSVADITKEIRDALHAVDMKDKKEDLTPEQLAGAAEAIIAKAGGNLQNRMLHEQMNPHDEQATHSEQFSAADLAGKLQAGVGGETEGKKQTDLLTQIARLIAQQQQNGGLEIKIA